MNQLNTLPSDPHNMIGAQGKAWKMDMDAICSKTLRSINICGWLLYAPYAHPLWHSYLLSCIALRDVPGVPPAKINMKGATHELFLAALVPDPPERYSLKTPPPPLHPLNFVAQFFAASDDEAAREMERTARDVIEGRLNPDTDYTQHWIARFGASNIKGVPSAAGETRIVVGGIEIVIPPVPAPKREGDLQ